MPLKVCAEILNFICRTFNFHRIMQKKAAINYYYSRQCEKRQWKIHQWAFISSATKQIISDWLQTRSSLCAAQIKEERDENIKIIAKKLENIKKN